MIQPIQPREPAVPVRSPGVEREPPAHPFMVLHRLLRHRYRWCALLAAVFGVLGAAVGYKWTRPLYRCDGIIQAMPLIPPVLAQIPENGYLQGFASFLDLQMTLLRSDRVIGMALQGPEWRALQRPAGDEPLKDFRQALIVKTPTKVSQMITVSFADADPRVAQAAVKSLLTAYNEIHVEGEFRSEETKKQLLEDRRIALSNELRLKQDSIRQAASQYGTDNLRGLSEMKTESLQRLENSLTDVEFALAALGADAALKAGPDGRPQADSMPQLAPAEIALRDDGMARLMTELQTLRTEAQIQSSRLGHNHPQMQELRMQIVARQQQINDHAAAWNANQARAGGLSSGVAGLSVAELTMRQTRYREMISQTRRELSELGRVMLDVERLGREKDDILIRLEETRRRLDLLNFESPVQGRIQIASFGEQPVLDKDKRIPLAMVGGIGGVGTGVGLVLLFALLDRRMRSPDDASPDAGRLQLLGVLPTLPDDPSDPEEAAIAAHCVHHIRAMLQVTGGAHGHRTFGLTSPTAGAGKTSLTLAVGASFAAANIRTLMIDCDVLGQGLSGRVGRVAHRRLGQMLLRTGQITEIQLERALAAASQSGRHLGEALVELGHLPQDRITDALQAQARSTLGLLDALGGEALDDCVVETGIRGLFILPAGAASPEDVSQLSPESLRTLMDKARSRFDVVLVDTGPVLGSLEASVLATVVDGMVLVVSRGESRTLAERAVRHLRSIGTPISGMVFNRADTRDVRRSSATSRISSFASGISCAGQDREPASRAALGPLASAVHNRRTAIDEHKPL